MSDIMDVSDEIMAKVMEGSVQAERKGGKRVKFPSNPVLITAALVLLGAVFMLWSLILDRAGEAARTAYESAKDTQSEAKYTEYYESSYQEAEAKAHVRNRVAIQVDSLMTEPRLEVLRAGDVEYSIIEPDKDGGNVTSWLEIPGYGVFTVDLSAGEFLVDDERRNVVVRIPHPELTQLTLDYENVRVLLWNQGYRNYSYRDGEDKARAQLDEGYTLIRKYMESNEKLYQNAEAAAVNMITYLVRQLNPMIPDLNVEIEFTDGKSNS